ncbi:MAG TPA: SDR family oxidoreductase [Nitrospinaceae bacterium]|jgi:UDP-glucose 4-epimerase|nr:SDR family oxidoreductase [Nitrospinaceae bacterium]
MPDVKILITGGLGYIGGRIADFLQRKHPELTIILGTSRKISEIPLWAKPFQIVRLNVCDKTTIDKAISSNLYAIIHLASLNEHESFSNIQFAWEVNALGTQSLLSIAKQKQVQKFIYFSTFHVYEDCQKMITEKSPTKAHHPYATTHRAAEDMVRFYHHSQDFDTLTLRLSNGFGYPMDLGVSRWTLAFNDLCRQAVTSGKMILKSSGKQHRDFICLHDIASAVDHFLYKNVKNWGDGLFNLGGDCSLSIVEVANKVDSIFKKKYCSSIPIEIQGKDDKTTHNPVKFNIDKLKNTGFRLTGNMDQEIERTLSLCESLTK